MRILVVTVAHSPQDARIRHREVQALLDAGHDVTLAAPFAVFGVAHEEAVRCLELPRSTGRHRLGPVWAAWRLLRREAGAHDVVLVHDPELLGALLACRHPARVWDVHEDVPAQVEMVAWLPAWVRTPFARLLHAVELVAERRVHLLLAEHGYAARFRRAHPVVPNTTRVPDQVAAGEGSRVVYVGAITAARGLEEMLAVAAALPDGVRLELIGNATPDVDARLRALPPTSGVDYRGFVPNARATERLSGALAGLALLHDRANYAHSQPSKLMEYMAHGVPAISTPNPAPAALLERHDSGYVVGFGAVDEVVARIRELAADPAAAAEMGRRGHRAARAEFDWNSDGPRFVATLERWAG